MKFDIRTMPAPGSGISSASESILKILSERGPMNRNGIELAMGRSGLSPVIDKLLNRGLTRYAGESTPQNRQRTIEITRLGLQRINKPVPATSSEGRITYFNKLTYNPAEFTVRGRVGLAVYQ